MYIHMYIILLGKECLHIISAKETIERPPMVTSRNSSTDSNDDIHVHVHLYTCFTNLHILYMHMYYGLEAVTSYCCIYYCGFCGHHLRYCLYLVMAGHSPSFDIRQSRIQSQHQSRQNSCLLVFSQTCLLVAHTGSAVGVCVCVCVCVRESVERFTCKALMFLMTLSSTSSVRQH